jgi:acyl carrier protein
MNQRTSDVIKLVAGVLKVPPDTIPPNGSMESVEGWDSLAQLTICMQFEERFGVALNMDAIAEATSIPELTALLPA